MIVDDRDRVLLCSFEIASLGVPLWATPGGGLEEGETVLVALARELAEEIGLVLVEDPPHIWREVIDDPRIAVGFDGLINDVYFVRVEAFEPRGSMSEAELAEEGVTGFQWWTQQELSMHAGPDLFGPRNLPDLVRVLMVDGVPAVPLEVG